MVEHLTLAQVMISWFGEFEPHTGFAAVSTEPNTGLELTNCEIMI